ncbi:MAG: SsrA-binding protein SmpB [Acidobacteria bacterium]|nr:SsrA-binding protein SmpB [Acidobacteriota bacterium]
MRNTAVKMITKNKKAFHDYEIVERLEAGLVLQGTEVKSIREGKINLKEAYAKVQNGEVWLVRCHISPYSHGNVHNHDPLRKRKLLLHRREIKKLIGKVKERGMTLIPLAVYLKNGMVKLEIGLGKGKKTVDKRAAQQEKTQKREIDKMLKQQHFYK